MEDRITKQKLNIFLLVDASKSMSGKRIEEVNQAIRDIKSYLKDFQSENSNVDFFLTIIPFNNDAYFYNNVKEVNVNNLVYSGIKCFGWSNLHCAYDKLAEILKKSSNGGIMPDFGGVAPIILLLTDGHPTGNDYLSALEKLQTMPWFKVALRYGIAIELDDKRTDKVLSKFVGGNGDVITCFDANMLKGIIKVIVLTASKVKSQTSNVIVNANVQQIPNNQNVIARQQIAEALSDEDNWEW